MVHHRPFLVCHTESTVVLSWFEVTGVFARSCRPVLFFLSRGMALDTRA